MIQRFDLKKSPKGRGWIDSGAGGGGKSVSSLFWHLTDIWLKNKQKYLDEDFPTQMSSVKMILSARYHPQKGIYLFRPFLL